MLGCLVPVLDVYFLPISLHLLGGLKIVNFREEVLFLVEVFRLWKKRNVLLVVLSSLPVEFVDVLFRFLLFFVFLSLDVKCADQIVNLLFTILIRTDSRFFELTVDGVPLTFWIKILDKTVDGFLRLRHQALILIVFRNPFGILRDLPTLSVR